MYKSLIIVTLTLLSFVSISGQNSVELTPSKDNTIFSDRTSNASGAGQLYIGKTCDGGIRRSVIQFEFPDSLGDISIDSAVLTIRILKDSKQNTKDGVFSLFRLTTPWGEGSSSGSGKGASAVNPDCTWTDAILNETPWTSPGGDFQSDTLATGQYTTTPGNVYIAGRAFTEEIINMISGSHTNDGWIIIGDEENSCSARPCGSKEKNQSPLLTLFYSKMDCSLSADSIDVSDGEIFCYDSAEEYQWLNCDTESPIEGANSASYKPDSDGKYAVVIKSGTCQDTSDCIDFTYVSSQTLSPLDEIAVYPTQTSSRVTIQIDRHGDYTLEVIDAMGKLHDKIDLKNEKLLTIDLPESRGLYYLKIRGLQDSKTFKVHKY